MILDVLDFSDIQHCNFHLEQVFQKSFLKFSGDLDFPYLSILFLGKEVGCSSSWQVKTGGTHQIHWVLVACVSFHGFMSPFSNGISPGLS